MMCIQLIAISMLSGLLLIGSTSMVADEKPQKKREQIGEAMGKPVYRDQIRTEKNVPLRDELHRLFAAAATQEYRKAHKKEITPTEAEITTVQTNVDKKHEAEKPAREAEYTKEIQKIEKQLAADGLSDDEKLKLQETRNNLQVGLAALEMPPGREFAIFLLNNWKFQRHLYDEYGGGRILWQQAGQEAFDAMHAWLKDLEKQGKFQITDDKLRETFYEYWTTMKHGPFLTDDKERIREEFLEPDWLVKAAPEK